MSFNISTAYNVDIDLPYGELNSILEWCKKNCSNEWGFSFSNASYNNSANNTSYPKCQWEFFFESKKDYVAFLIWKK